MSADTSIPAPAGQPVRADAGPAARQAAVAQKSRRAFYVFSAVTLAVGGFLILNGGRQHPAITQHMGTFGTPGFYTHFAQMMMAPDWYELHAQIMWGPVVAALGALGMVSLVRSRGDSRWSTLGLIALSMGTVLWTLVYCFDGFISPKLAPLLLNSSPELEPAMNGVFGSSQWAAITIATPGWILMSAGQLFLGVSVLITRSVGRGRGLSTVVGVGGILLGVSSLLAWATGSFDPGPMISPWWLMNAYAGAIWFLIAAVWVFLHRRTAEDATATAS
ncbi:hypothetical protein [Amycolatopsis sp. H20-H5]|uniref:hypothetical protein n=1 Tax=Amycolatopsis sp. H20-H5 TaxID=3046309 RepID=UPI002DB6FDB0|nr:hypothetical protein [Amycolatopsis sp. H20-H5]MEC3976896.1 hypothetical protein [Amycolatopsis sp. H20-H5]